jgi:hypothetical protein
LFLTSRLLDFLPDKIYYAVPVGRTMRGVVVVILRIVDGAQRGAKFEKLTIAIK